MPPDAPRRAPGLLDAARDALVALLEIGHTRLQLASTELEEERLRLVALAVCAGAALYCLAIGLALASCLIVLLVGEGQRVLTLALLSASFLGASAVLAGVWKHRSAGKPRLLAATIDELRKDRQALAEATGGPP